VVDYGQPRDFLFALFPDRVCRKKEYAMDTLQALQSRKSVRNYLAGPVENDKLELLLKAANSAPKAGEFHISLVLNPALLREINDKAHQAMKDSGNDFLVERAALPGYRPLYGAPALLIFSAPAENPFSPATTANAATTAAIAATALGLGSCYVVTPTLALNADAALAGKLGIPSGYTTMCGLLAGYAGEENVAAPRFAGTENITRVS
jgi:nitroreductase